jgi:hypothetical protein
MPQFLENQLKTISDHVLSSHAVILNCNDYMFGKLTKKTLPPNIYINPEIINKAAWTGQITQGIVSNMKYALEKFIFKHFIVLSGRTILYRNMRTCDLDILTIKWPSLEIMNQKLKGAFTEMGWHWPTFRRTLLAQHYINRGYRLYGSAHEGLVFSYNVCKNIIKFFDLHVDIKNDLFQFHHCVEEFALQSISLNEVGSDNLEYGFSNIGHGIGEDCDMNAPHKYTRKIAYR